MGLLKKLTTFLNGTPPTHNQAVPADQVSDKNQDSSTITPTKNSENMGVNEIAGIRQRDLTATKPDVPEDIQSGEHGNEHEEMATGNDKQISSENKENNSSNTQSIGFGSEDKALYSGSPYEQRYAWHKYLFSILSAVKTEHESTLKHFTIYIRQIAGVKYQWNDEVFKNELLSSLEPYDCASYIGSSSFSIEVVLDKAFKQVEEKSINKDTQFKLQLDDIILFGSKTETAEQKFATAIDKRAFVIKELLKKFRDSTGTDTTLMENLAIIVVRNEDDDDMAKYDWVGKRFEDDLRRELTNAFLDPIGSKSIQIVFKPKSETDGCISLIDNQVYYKWGKANTSQYDTDEEIPYQRITATLSIIEGSGSMTKPSYLLDSDRKKIYHIGRGVSSRNGGIYRINDIVIKDNEYDSELLERNNHVSGTHADIVFNNNKFCIKAALGGCRANGGSPTKIIHDEHATELRDTNLLYALEDGDIIELGKNVLLIYSNSNTDSLSDFTDKPKKNNAMSVDDSF